MPYMNKEEFERHVNALVDEYIDIVRAHDKDKMDAFTSKLENNLGSTRTAFLEALGEELYRYWYIRQVKTHKKNMRSQS